MVAVSAQPGCVGGLLNSPGWCCRTVLLAVLLLSCSNPAAAARLLSSAPAPAPAASADSNVTTGASYITEARYACPSNYRWANEALGSYQVGSSCNIVDKTRRNRGLHSADASLRLYLLWSWRHRLLEQLVAVGGCRHDGGWTMSVQTCTIAICPAGWSTTGWRCYMGRQTSFRTASRCEASIWPLRLQLNCRFALGPRFMSAWANLLPLFTAC